MGCKGSSKMPPIVTWGRHLSTRGGLAGVMRWAVHVKRQTGRWFFGFVRPPLSRDYGLILDVASDGCVYGNYGAVYRTSSEAQVSEITKSPDLEYEELPKMHRLSVTTDCELVRATARLPSFACANHCWSQSLWCTLTPHRLPKAGTKVLN